MSYEVLERLRGILESEDDGPVEQVAQAYDLVCTALASVSIPDEEPVAFQQRVDPWMQACFGPEIAADRLERGDRLLEEVLELLQSGDYPPERVAALTNYTYGRDKGEPHQEAGGVMVTMAAYCLAHGLNMHRAAEDELARIWTKVDKIRAKQAAKPTGSALPVASPAAKVAVRDEPPSLEQAFHAAVTAARAFYDAASYEETLWTGWGEQIVPPYAEMRRVKAKQALSALLDSDPRRAALEPTPANEGGDGWISESMRLAAQQILVLHPQLPPLAASLLGKVATMPTSASPIKKEQ